MADTDQYADLVFEGGGVKGIGLAGAYAALSERGLRAQMRGRDVGGRHHRRGRWRRATARPSSTTSPEPSVRRASRIRTGRTRLGTPGKLVSLIREKGIYEGNYFRDWIAGLLEAKGKTRFGHLAFEPTTRPEKGYGLKVIASDITHRRMLVLPDDAGHLGVDPDELEIAYAVRMSMSIPIFFEPVVHENPSQAAAPDRGRRDAVELPGLALRRPGPRATLADVRADAGGARSEGPARPSARRARTTACRAAP